VGIPREILIEKDDPNSFSLASRVSRYEDIFSPLFVVVCEKRRKKEI